MNSPSRRPLRHVIAGLVAAVSTGWLPVAAHGEDASDGIPDNAAVFIDGNTFQVVPSKAGSDTKAQIRSLGARELGPGAIVFRAGDKLYIVDVPLRIPGAGEGPDIYVTADQEDSKPIEIEYVPPKNPEHQKIYDMVKERHVLETVQQMFSMFRLPVAVTVQTVGCDGVANAWYERKGKRPTISLCYEYLQELGKGMPQEVSAGTMSDAICGQLLFAVAHEFGHAIIDIYDVPVFGRQEDAADQLATYFMLQFGGAQSYQMIRGAAYAYHEYIKDYKDKPNVTLPLAAFSSTHGTPEERFFNLMCIAYGYDPKLFADVAEKELPQSRAKNCDIEYQDLKFAVTQLVHPHVDEQKARKIFMMTWVSTSGAQPGAP